MTTLKPSPDPRRANGKPRSSNAAGPVAPKRSEGGFSLLELSIVLIIIGLVVGVSVDMGLYTFEVVKEVANNHKLNVIEQALQSYRLTNERLPCPADGSLAPTDANYGAEAGTLSGGQWVPDAGSCITYGTYSSGALTSTAANSVAANYNYKLPSPPSTTTIAGGTAVAEGVVPFKALSLPESFMYDAWGRKFTYAVWAPGTAVATPASAAAFGTYGIAQNCGAINVKVNSTETTATRSTRADYVLVSFGPDGHGAYTKYGGATRYNAGSTNADEQTNAHMDKNGADTGYAAIYAGHAWTQDPNDSKDIYDDTVRFKERWQMVNQHDYFAVNGNPCWPGLVVNGDQSISTGTNAYMMAVATGDVNGDGIPDLIIASPTVNTGTGTIYVVFGTKQGFPNPLPLSSCDGTKCAEFNGSAATIYAGTSLAIGDVNGDGIADIIIGAGNLSYAGNSYVVFGHTGTWNTTPKTLNSTFLNGANGFSLTGKVNPYGVGWSVAAGDVNGDGIADIIVSAPKAGLTFALGHTYFGLNPTNGQYIYLDGVKWTFVASGATGTQTNISGTPGGNNLTDIGNTVATLAADLTAYAAANPGSNIALATYSASSTSLYITYKTAGSSGNNYTLCGNPTTTNCTYPGNGDYYYIGFPSAGVSVHGNLSGGYDGTQYQGAVYVVFGGRTGAGNGAGTAWTSCNPCTLDSTFLNGTNGIEYDGTVANEDVGDGLAVGDVNGDGIADIAIGTGINSNGVCCTNDQAFLIFGKRCGGSYAACTTPVLLNSTFLNGINGAEFDTGNTSYGANGLAIGDVNGDGTADLVISDPRSTATYIVFGKAAGWPTTATNLYNNSTFINGVNAVKYTHADNGGKIAVGDVNGDGISDILIAPYVSFSAARPAYAVFGQSPLLPQTTITTSAGSSSATVAAYTGLMVGQTVSASTLSAGTTISSCGGGAACTSTSITLSQSASGSGTVSMYVSIQPVNSTFLNGTYGSELDSVNRAGNANLVSLVAGDINGDGIRDVIESNGYAASASGPAAGQIYIYFGKKNLWPTSPYTLTNLCSGC